MTQERVAISALPERIASLVSGAPWEGARPERSAAAE